MNAEQLANLPFFSELTDEERTAIAPYAKLDQVPPGTVLVEEGDFSRELIVIEDGEAEVERGGEVVGSLGAGDFFGEIGVLDNQLRNATVKAKTALTTVSLDSFDMRRLRKRFPDLVERIHQVGEQRSS
jgi:cAMP-dependent protein kinase regulator